MASWIRIMTDYGMPAGELAEAGCVSLSPSADVSEEGLLRPLLILSRIGC